MSQAARRIADRVGDELSERHLRNLGWATATVIGDTIHLTTALEREDDEPILRRFTITVDEED